MRPTAWLATAAFVLSAGAAQAQFYGGFAPRQSVAIQVRTGPYTGFSYYARSYGFGYPGWYYGPNGLPVSANPFGQPPVIINNIIQAPPAAGPAPVARGPVIAGDLEAAPPPVAKPQAKAAKPAPKPPVVDPPVIVPAPRAPRAPGRVDADRTADAGRRAFADGQYGRAVELFRRAAEITPNEPSAHYLVSQAYFALGKYREAVAAIAAGIALRADWPEARFNSRDVYGKTPELFDDHLKALRQAVEAFPDDPNLLFLLGHQLWFDGKQAEARGLMLKARALDRGLTPAGTFALK